MTLQTFRELLGQRPFKPFRLVMSSGQNHEVRHPEMALLTRTDILVGVDIAEDGVPAEFKICSLLHVTAVEPLTPTASRRGKRRTRGAIRLTPRALPDGLDLLRGSQLPEMARALDTREHQAVDLLVRIGLATQRRAAFDGPHIAQGKKKASLKYLIGN